MAKVNASALQILATILAYMINADSEVTLEEKAKLVTVFGKYLSRGEMREDQFSRMVKEAFTYANRIDIDTFIDGIENKLSPGQKAAAIINLSDAMLVDGKIVASEKKVIEKFIGAFHISHGVVRAIREVINLKNDTGIFTDPNHHFNEPRYRLDIQIFGDAAQD